ncbi:MAG TPA: DNA gyrase subunit A [Anaerolineae bacterium]|nr:DNA gyrase subunit A [Anaerolineae bacterium]
MLGNIRTIDIEQEMRGAYLDYAMSVIVARALPDARDGLKPVQRRILYAMHDMGLRANTPFKKSARIVGEVLGKYHPHGDSAVYDAMARMAQDFSVRYLLVDGQGNFGSIDGDAPAAMRYTEARLTRLSEELLADIDKATVDWTENFDGTLKEPAVLPSQLPNLLLNGATGIAVGMATSIPPHNLTEVANAIGFLIDRWETIIERRRQAAATAQQPFGRDEQLAVLNEVFATADDDVTVDDLMQFIKGPDFPTGALVLGREGIVNAYVTGKGRIVMRGVANIEEMKGGRFRIVITEIPYQVNKSALIERMAELVRDERIPDISDIRDESDRNGLTVVIELKRGAQPKTVLNKLYKFTALQTTFGAQMLALVDGQPRLLSLKRALQLFVEHRQAVLTRRAEFDLAKAQHRAHILEGLRIALANLDAVIQTIRQSPDADTARTRLMERFKLTEVQAQAILDMPLRRLAALERQKIEDEYQQVMQTIAYLEDLLANPYKLLTLVKEESVALKEKYGDARRTRIAAEATEEMSIEDLVADEEVLIQLTERGYVKRLPVKAFRAQARGGRGVTGIQTREEDAVQYIFSTRTLQHLLFFSDRGKVYHLRAYEIPDADRTAKGVPLVNLINLSESERITAAVSVPDFDPSAYFVMCTRNGRIKRVPAEEFEAVRPSGIIAIALDDGDVLGWVKVTRGDQDIIIVTEQGQALRFSSKLVRPMGRAAAGVTAMRLGDEDHIVSMEAVTPNGELLVVTARGYGKRTPLEQYPIKGRATGGVRTLADRIDETGVITSARVVLPDDEVTIITAGGIALRTAVGNIARSGRSTRGVHVIALQDGDTVASVARIENNVRAIAGADGQAEESTSLLSGNGQAGVAEVAK